MNLKNLLAKHHLSESELETFFNLSPDLFCIIQHDWYFRELNPSWEKVLGWSLQKLRSHSWLDIIHPDDRAITKISQQQCYQNGFGKFENRCLHKNGSYRHLSWNVACHEDGLMYAVGREISDRQQTDSTLHPTVKSYLYAHDHQLTSSPNRVLFLEKLKQQTELATIREDYLFAVLYLKLDSFEIIKYSLGNPTAEQMLNIASQRIVACLHPNDIVMQVGTEDFAILLKDIPEIEQVSNIVTQIQEVISSPFYLQEQEIFTTASIGIVFNKNNNSDLLAPHFFQRPEELLGAADTAMYHAKKLGKGRSVMFSSTMQTGAMSRLQLETDLRRAIQQSPGSDRAKLILYYQPIVSLSTGKIIGFEALVRLSHPEQGLISPAEFIPVAEETGLIVPLGKWVLRQACLQLHTWQQLNAAYSALTVSVNLSGVQLVQPNFIEQITEILTETGIKGQFLNLEIKESVLMENAEYITTRLWQLRDLNIHLSIDDFGTGYSCLSKLHHFPINMLKIDRPFVRRISHDEESWKIVRTLVALASNLCLQVVVEGVRTTEQLAKLKMLKWQCHYGQGALFSMPVDSQAATSLLIASQKW